MNLNQEAAAKTVTPKTNTKHCSLSVAISADAGMPESSENYILRCNRRYVTLSNEVGLSLIHCRRLCPIAKKGGAENRSLN